MVVFIGERNNVIKQIKKLLEEHDNGIVFSDDEIELIKRQFPTVGCARLTDIINKNREEKVTVEQVSDFAQNKLNLRLNNPKRLGGRFYKGRDSYE